MRGIAMLILLGVSACATGPRSPGRCDTASSSAAHDTAAIRAAAAPRSEPTHVVGPTVSIQGDTAVALVGEAGSNITTLVRVVRQEGCWRSVGEVGHIMR